MSSPEKVGVDSRAETSMGLVAAQVKFGQPAWRATAWAAAAIASGSPR